MENEIKRKALIRALRLALLACLLSWGIFFGVESINSDLTRQNDLATQLLASYFGNLLAMLGPALAVLLLWRFIDKQSPPAFKWSRLRYYLAIAAGMLALRALTISIGNSIEPYDTGLRSPIESYIWIIVGSSLTLGWVGGLGEELGWTAYLLSALTPAFGKTRAVIASGIIRGIWHLPVLAWPLILEARQGKIALNEFAVALLTLIVFLALSNIFFSAMMGWLWFRTESIALTGWAHQWFDAARDFAPLLIIGVAGSATTALAWSILIHLIQLLALVWLARQERTNLKSISPT